MQPGHGPRRPGEAARDHKHVDQRYQRGVSATAACPAAGVVGVQRRRALPRADPGYLSTASPPFNIVISNVSTGRSEPLYWHGARLDGNYPLSIALDGQAVNITVTNNADNLDFGLVGCRRSVPHLQRLLGHLDTSLKDLERAVGA